ncbi:uncharacterized protein [Branchiostoma lanceolatum]|uniref:uncharacterized protein n=1 Tax=Branchiostoma lanceolatum TaxID=7740 RepID=UPI0034532B72
MSRQGQRSRLACLTCTDRQKSCSHVSAYKQWCKDRGVDSEVVLIATKEQTFDSISKSPFAYPWSSEMAQKLMMYENQRTKFPRHLIPDTPTRPCPHGHSWDARDPVEQGWIVYSGVTIYTRMGTLTEYFEDDAGTSHPRVAYYRPTEGQCSCRHFYDGLGDLLHNVDNRNMFYMGFRLDYLHSMIDSKQPLKSTQSSTNRTRSAGSDNGFKAMPYEMFRKGWNSFARRIDINWDKVFSCPECGPEPDTVICDGTAVGFRKDLIAGCTPEPCDGVSSSSNTVQGSRHSDRVFLTSEKARRLLLQYSGSKRGTRGMSKGLSEEEMKTLLGLLEVENRQDIADIIRRLLEGDDGHGKGDDGDPVRMAPAGYSGFFAELARYTPVCGMLQIAGDDIAMKIAKKVAKGKILLGQERYGEYFSYLQKKAPILCTFVHIIGKEGHIPSDVSTLILNLIKILKSTFDKVPVPSPSCYPPPPPSSLLSFFPCLRKRCGLPPYAMDKRRRVKARDGCRKDSYGHPSLTPGLFTIFCKHGVC